MTVPPDYSTPATPWPNQTAGQSSPLGISPTGVPYGYSPAPPYFPSAPYAMAPQQPPKKRSSGWLWILLAAVIALVVGIVVGRASASPAAAPTVTVTSTATVTQTSVETKTITAPPAPPTTTAAPGGEASEGTRNHPFPFGSALTATLAAGGEVDMLLGAANWDANAAVAAENQFNDSAPDGSTFVLLPVTVTNKSSPKPVKPAYDVNISYVAPDGRSFTEEFEVAPDSWHDIADLYEGGSATGNVLFAIPTDQLQNGVWAVSFGYSSDRVFVSAS